jgi:uncharacterized SAM-dependent methyltransferase
MPFGGALLRKINVNFGHNFEVEQFGTIHIYWPGRKKLEMNSELVP